MSKEEKKKLNTLSIILIIVSGVLLISSLVLGVCLINASNEKADLTAKLNEANESQDSANDAGLLYMRLSNSYCQMYLEQDEDFCYDYNLDLVKDMMVNDAFGD